MPESGAAARSTYASSGRLRRDTGSVRFSGLGKFCDWPGQASFGSGGDPGVCRASTARRKSAQPFIVVAQGNDKNYEQFG